MPVQFNEPPSASRRRTKQPSLFSRLVISTGLAKTQTGAQTVMILAAIIAVAIGFFLIQHANRLPPPPDPEQTRITP